MEELLVNSTPRRTSTVLGVIALAARVTLGAAFLFAAYTKLSDPALFADAIQKFKYTTEHDHDHLVKLGAFAIPWTEAVCGAALVLGLWTRAAALVLVALLGFFTFAIYEVVASGETFKCGCFGRLRLFCPEELSRCNLWQNGGLAAIGLTALGLGGGRFSLDWLLRRRATPRITVEETRPTLRPL